MNKKFLSLALIGALSLTSLVGCSMKNKVEDDTLKVTLVLDEGGVNDQSFNESAWNGAKKLKEDFPQLDIGYIESKQEADYMSNLETAVDNDSDLVIGVGFKIADALKEAAEAYPDTKFVMIDNTYEETPENVQTISFDEAQSGYLVGLIAAKMTETNKIAFLGGMDIPTCSRFADGFEKAIKEVNPEIEITRQFTNSFTDAAKAKAMANQIFSTGVDIIFSAAGGGNAGIFESARELNKFVIGVDSPSSYLAPEIVITSALKDVGQGVYNVVKEVMNDNFKGGENVRYDIKSGAINFEDTDLIPADIKVFVKDAMTVMAE